MKQAIYIHGTDPEEQARLRLLNRLTNPSFLRFLRIRPDERVLEVGCGVGILSQQAARRTPQGLMAAVERSPDQLAQCRRRPGPAYTRGDALRLPFRDGVFDLVYCRFLLEHLAHPQEAAAEFRRVLRPGGRLAVQENDVSVLRTDPECPAFQHAWERFCLLQQRLGGDPYAGRKLFGIVREAGFDEIRLSAAPEVHWYGRPGYREWLENLAGNLRSAEEALLAEGLLTTAAIQEAYRELRALAECQHGAAWFVWNRVEAYRRDKPAGTVLPMAAGRSQRGLSHEPDTANPGHAG